ncbi:DUF4265 domain-containing protein [Agromyces sp. NPDC058064]|uniref:DUF4265 domain-containing protein n=1 Tax=Agromyces sp. NPDC058064 TaxID=3346322 RepID=UPI0036DF0B15
MGWPISGRNRQAVHRDPIWRDRADFIIGVEIDSSDTDVTSEQLWARKVDETHFMICCIPFFVYDLALGDIVEVDSGYQVERVSAASGRYVFRAYFEEARLRYRDEVVFGLAERGALVEWSSQSMFAVDARDAEHAQAIADYLHDREQNAWLEYETGKTA